MSTFTSGLRELADYLDKHPCVPQPDHPQITVCTPHDLEDDGALSEVVRIAAVFGTDVAVNAAATIRTAHRAFGPIEYELVSVTQAAMAAHYERISYEPNLRGVAS